MLGKHLVEFNRRRSIVGKSLEDMVKQDHFVRKIEDAVDFSFIYDEVKCHYPDNGAPSIDPAVLIKMMLIGFFYNIPEEEKLIEAISDSVAFRWFIGYALDEEIPDRTNLGRARKRWQEPTFLRIFERVVEMCIEAGLVGDKSVSIDSTCVKAKGTPEIDEMYRENLIKAHIEAAEEAGEAIDYAALEQIADAVPPKRSSNPKKKLYPPNLNHADISPLSSQAYKPDATIAEGNHQVLRHDPDARFTHKKFVGYKDNRLVDHKYGVNLRVLATPGNVSDTAVVSDLLRTFVQRHKIQHECLVMDGGYKAQDILVFAEEMGYQVYTPLYRSVNTNKGMYGPGDFRYDEKKDVLICPAGQKLHYIRVQNRGATKEYRARAKVCNQCTRKAKCTTSDRGRTSTLVLKDKIIARIRARRGTRKYRFLMAKRQIYSEGSFGEAKVQFGMREARLRGLENMNIQSLMTSMAQNIKKLIKYAHKLKPAVSKLAKATQEVVCAFTDLYRATRCYLFIALEWV